MNWDTFDCKIQLHELVEIHYYVTHYEAVLLTQDGGQEVARAEGETVLEALENLEPLIRDWSK